MKITKTALAIVFATIAMAAFAQENNGVYTVKVHDLKYNAPDNEPTAGEVIGAVIDGLSGHGTNTRNSHLVPKVNAGLRAAITKVRRLAPVDGLEGSYFSLDGEINSIVTHSTTRKVERQTMNGHTYTAFVHNYEASIGVTLVLTELGSGQQWTNSFSGNNAWYSLPESEDQAFDDALKLLLDQIEKGYNAMFPLVATIIEAGEASKDRQKEVYIDLGSSLELKKGNKFEVFELNVIAGREARKKIGKLKIEEVMGEDISRCKVEKGHKEIKKALDEAKTLLVVSVE